MVLVDVGTMLLFNFMEMRLVSGTWSLLVYQFGRGGGEVERQDDEGNQLEYYCPLTNRMESAILHIMTRCQISIFCADRGFS